MGRKTSGTLYTSGKNNFFYLRYRFEGKETRMRLLDLAGKPVTSPKEARAAADRILAHIRESNRAEQLRTIKNDIRDAEQAAEQAAAQLVNSRATISGAWQLFMSCPKRPAGCRRFPSDAIPEHTTVGNYRRFLGKLQKFIEKNYPDARLLSDITPEIAADFMQSLQHRSSGTFNQYLNNLRAIFNTVIKAGKMRGKNPFAEIEPMPQHYNSKRPLSVEQIARLIDKASGELRVLFALGYFTGLRLGSAGRRSILSAESSNEFPAKRSTPSRTAVKRPLKSEFLLFCSRCSSPIRRSSGPGTCCRIPRRIICGIPAPSRIEFPVILNGVALKRNDRGPGYKKSSIRKPARSAASAVTPWSSTGFTLSATPTSATTQRQELRPPSFSETPGTPTQQ